MEASLGDAVAATWILCGDESRRRPRRRVATPWPRSVATSRGDARDVDIPRRVVAIASTQVFLTDDVAMCSFLYRKSQPVKAAVRKMLRTARGSCFRHEARTARHIRGFSNHDVDVQCNANTHGLNAEMKVLVPIAATFLLVGNWFLCQWMPARGPRRNHEASPRPRPASTFRDEADPRRLRLAASPRLAVDVPRTKSNREASLLRRN